MVHIDAAGRLSVRDEVRVLVVEDHPVVRRGMVEVINEQDDLHVCGETDSMPEAMRLLNETSPRVVLVDLGLSSGHGIELIEMIRERCPHVKILVVSAQDERLYAERCLRAGAAGYIGKQEATDRLVDAIRQVIAGEVSLSKNMANQLLHTMVGGNELRTDPISTLTNRELEVYEMIGRGLTTRQIADQLVLSPKTVESHREKIKIKLDLANTNELMRHAVEWVLQNP